MVHSIRIVGIIRLLNMMNNDIELWNDTPLSPVLGYHSRLFSCLLIMLSLLWNSLL